MSYDIIFLAKQPEQSWAEALKANEVDLDEFEKNGFRPLSASPINWLSVTESLMHSNPRYSHFADDHHLEFTDGLVGVQVSLYADEAAITIPYWHMGKSAEYVIQLAVAAARIIEAETHFVGFDFQLGRPFLNKERNAPDAITFLQATSNMVQTRIVGARPVPRKWWQFWRRP